MTPHLAVCLGFRDWSVDHLRRTLASLRSTDAACSRGWELEITVVDTSAAIDPRVQHACNRFGVFLVHGPRAEWSRAYALNAASRSASSAAEWLVCTDADMVFPAGWLAAVGTQVTAGSLLLTRTRDTHEGQTVDEPFDDVALHRATTPHPETGEGGAMIVPKGWFRAVRGFDETYRVWGCEDNDLTMRARRDGLDVRWAEGTFVVHQWHRRDWPTAAQYDQVRENRRYFSEQAGRDPFLVARNAQGWAGVREETEEGERILWLKERR